MLDQRSARSLVLAVAGGNVIDNRKSIWTKAARVSGVTIRTIKSIWYGTITDEDHRAVRKLRASAASRAATLAGRYEAIAAAMEQADANLYRQDIIALCNAAHALEAARNSLALPSS